MPIQHSPRLVSQSSRCAQKASAVAGMVLECNNRGVLLAIRRDNLGLLHGIAPGISFHHLVERGSLDKAFAFLTELKKRGSAFGWELKISLASQPTTLYVGGLVKGGLFLIFGTRTQGGLLRFSRYFLDKGQLGAEKGTAPEDIPLAPILDERELAFQEMLSCTQSHLVNLKRSLARKNIRLNLVIAELKASRAGMHILQGLVPICSSCKKIRDPQGNWHQVETFFSNHAGIQFTHSICPGCTQTLYPGLPTNK
jgi:hypothetical protein